MRPLRVRKGVRPPRPPVSPVLLKLRRSPQGEKLRCCSLRGTTTLLSPGGTTLSCPGGGERQASASGDQKGFRRSSPLLRSSSDFTIRPQGNDARSCRHCSPVRGKTVYNAPVALSPYRGLAKGAFPYGAQGHKGRKGFLSVLPLVPLWERGTKALPQGTVSSILLLSP